MKPERTAARRWRGRTALLAAVILMGAGRAGAQPLAGGLGGGTVVLPGSTVQGDIDRGRGLLLAGLGQFNLDLAQANAINTQTAIGLNEYIYQSKLQMRRQLAAKLEADRQRGLAADRAFDRRLLQAPNERDLMSGNTINRLIEELSGYQVASSLLRVEAVDLPVEQIRKVPFAYPVIGGVISLRRMLPPDEEWPVALRGDSLQERRGAYKRAVGRALEAIEEGRLGLPEIRAITDSIDRLRAGMIRPAADGERTAHYEALAFLRQLQQGAETLQDSATSVAIHQLDEFHGTTVADLVEFMRRFDLRFAPANSPEERVTYNDLYRVLIEQRQRLAEKGLFAVEPGAAPRPGDRR